MQKTISEVCFYNTVKIGGLEFEGLVLSDGSEAFELEEAAHYLSIKPSTIGEILKEETLIEKQRVKLINSTTQYLTKQQLINFCYCWTCSGRDKNGRSYEIAYAYYSREDILPSKISILEGLRALEKSHKKTLNKRSDKQRENDLKEKYSIKWNCEKDFTVGYQTPMEELPIGSADLVNDRLVAQIKNCRDWKSSMGELLAYQEVLQRRELWLILFKARVQDTRPIKDITAHQGIGVKFIKN